VRYTLKNWTALTGYCEDGDMAIREQRHRARDPRGSCWP